MDETLFICPHCHHRYNETDRIPRIFPICGHSFCSDCLTKLLTQNPQQVSCPLDQMVYNIPPGTQPFPENIGLKGILKSLAGQERCKFHGKKLTLMCFTDNEKICNHCVQFGDHKDHKFKLIKNIKTDAEKTMEDLKTVSEKAELCKGEISSLFREKEGYLVNFIRERFQDIKSVLEEKETQLLTSTNAFFGNGVGKVEDTFGPQSHLRQRIDERSERIKKIVKEDEMKDFEEEYPLATAFEFASEFAQQHVNHLMHKLEETSDVFQTTIAEKLLEPLKGIGIPFEELNKEVQTAMMETESLIENDDNTVYPNSFNGLFTIKQRDQSLAFSDKTDDKSAGKDSPLGTKHYQTITMVGLKFLKNPLVGEALMTILNLYRRIKAVKCLKVDFSQRKIDHRELIGVYSLMWAMQSHIEIYEFLLEAAQFEEKALNSVFAGALSRLVNLKKITLDLRNSNVTDSVIESLVKGLDQVKTLEYLKLKLASTKVKDESVSKLFSVDLPMLKWIAINLNNTLVSDKSIEALAQKGLPNMKSLEHLELRLCLTKVTDDSLSQLLVADLSNLKSFSLGLNFTKVTGKSLDVFSTKTLGNMVNLECLELHLRCMHISDQSLTQLFMNKLGKLKTFTLDLSHNQVHDESLKIFGESMLPDMKLLEHLELYFGSNEITDKGFSSLPMNQIGLIKSFSLQFENTKISEKTADQIASFMNNKLNRKDIQRKGNKIITQM